VGRPITNIQPNLNLPDLKALVDDALESLATRSVEVRDSSDAITVQDFNGVIQARNRRERRNADTAGAARGL
jgi:hypothetical protein